MEAVIDLAGEWPAYFRVKRVLLPECETGDVQVALGEMTELLASEHYPNAVLATETRYWPAMTTRIVVEAEGREGVLYLDQIASKVEEVIRLICKGGLLPHRAVEQVFKPAKDQPKGE